MTSPAYDFHGPDWIDGKTDAWRALLGHLVGLPSVLAMEVGCYEGRSACWWIDHILTGPSSRLVCVDQWCDYDDDHIRHTVTEWQMIEARFHANVAQAIGAHRRQVNLQVVSRPQDHTSNGYDFIYLDGSHRAPDVLRDLVTCWPMLRKGGVMICDDYRDELGVRVAVNAFSACHALDVVVQHVAGQVVLKHAR